MKGGEARYHYSMTPQEEKVIARWREHIPEKILLTVAWNNDESGRKIRAFCKAFQSLVPQIFFDEEEIPDGSMPEIRVRENIRYSAVPEAKELEPFLRAVYSVEPLAASLQAHLLGLLEQLAVPASIRVYISPQCPFCPQAVLQCLALARASVLCRVLVVDAALFPEQSEQESIRSVPTITLDRAFRWTGSVETRELVNVICHRDPLQLSSDSLEKMLHSGRAGELAEMMAQRGEVFPGLVDLLVHSKWPVRLGAMVTFQHLVESRPDLAYQIALSLWDRFPRLEDPIKGDVLFLFGECRNPSFFPILNSIIEGRHPAEVKEAAREAVKEMMGPTATKERSRLKKS
jgi:hypothetical protein